MASVITYAYPVAGTTAPTAAQAAAAASLTATVQMGDADTNAVVVHNWKLTAAQLAQLLPWASVYPQVSGTAAATLSVALTDSSNVTVTKPGVGVGSGGTWVVVLQRPHSMIQ